jgi:flagellar L-ring protein FlgH
MLHLLESKAFRLALCAVAAAALSKSGLAQLQSGARSGSIYNPNAGPISPIADKTARRAGDLLTVIVSETNDISKEEQSELAKSTNLNYELTTFQLASNLFNPLPDLGANSSDQFSGQAQVQKRDTFEARLTAMVVDVLPNGNLVLSGRREVRVEDQTKLIEFSGVVRKFDVTPLNTIQSELVADARISYVGNGPATRTTQRTGGGSWVHRTLDWLWPF